MDSPITLTEALENIKKLKRTYYFKRESETVSLNDSVGRELSEDIIAESMSPVFDIAAMDGFAVRSQDHYPLTISGSVYAGDSIVKINCGEAIAIATGALLPDGADAVLKMEDSEVRKNLLYGKSFRNGKTFSEKDRITVQAIGYLRKITV